LTACLYAMRPRPMCKRRAGVDRFFVKSSYRSNRSARAPHGVRAVVLSIPQLLTRDGELRPPPIVGRARPLVRSPSAHLNQHVRVPGRSGRLRVPGHRKSTRCDLSAQEERPGGCPAWTLRQLRTGVSQDAASVSTFVGRKYGPWIRGGKEGRPAVRPLFTLATLRRWRFSRALVPDPLMGTLGG
jgi:hypothetical protein